MIRILLAALLLISAAPAAAQEGRWAVRAGGQTLILLEVERAPGAGGALTGRMVRPDHFSVSTGEGAQPFVFSEVTGPTVTRRITAAAQTPRGLELTVEGRRPGSTELFLFRPGPGEGARLYFAGIEQTYLPLARAAAGEAVAAAWAPGRSYATEILWPTNAEMTAIFDVDQADRSPGAAIDWAVVTPRDVARRARVRALLDAGALNSGDDFYHAAFVFQHGSEPGDYLLAHSFALIAAARGRPDATWIGAATLDRYLQAIHQPQIYGTQFLTPPGQPTSQEPYDRALVSDALRAALGVPDQAGQERQRARFEAGVRAAEAARRTPSH
jgi:hypothetical protein